MRATEAAGTGAEFRFGQGAQTQVVPNAYPEPNTTLSASIRVAFDVSQTSPAMKRLAR